MNILYKNSLSFLVLSFISFSLSATESPADNQVETITTRLSMNQYYIGSVEQSVKKIPSQHLETFLTMTTYFCKSIEDPSRISVIHALSQIAQNTPERLSPQFQTTVDLLSCNMKRHNTTVVISACGRIVPASLENFKHAAIRITESMKQPFYKASAIEMLSYINPQTHPMYLTQKFADQVNAFTQNMSDKDKIRVLSAFGWANPQQLEIITQELADNFKIIHKNIPGYARAQLIVDLANSCKNTPPKKRKQAINCKISQAFYAALKYDAQRTKKKG